MNKTDKKSQSTSTPYAAFSVVVGIALAAALTYAGYTGLPLIPTILVGAAAQTVFRIIKRNWKNSLTKLAAEDAAAEHESGENRKALILVFVAMIAVSAAWYGVGWFFR